MRRSLYIQLITAVLIILAVRACWLRVAPPADQEMIDNFYRHRDQFEELRRIVCRLPADRTEVMHGARFMTVMMDPEWARPQIPDAEKQRYYSLLKTIGATGVQGEVQPECVLDIEVWSTGFAGNGDYKHYHYGVDHDPNAKQMTRVGSLDEVNSVKFNLKSLKDESPDKIAFYYRPITGNWRLEFDHWP
ncbi:MAG: hypothetical protein WDN72_04160 [Alphaproteobacteria bacterium]